MFVVIFFYSVKWHWLLLGLAYSHLSSWSCCFIFSIARITRKFAFPKQNHCYFSLFHFFLNWLKYVGIWISFWPLTIKQSAGMRNNTHSVRSKVVFWRKIHYPNAVLALVEFRKSISLFVGKNSLKWISTMNKR